MIKKRYFLFPAAAFFVLVLAASCTGGPLSKGGKNFTLEETMASILLYPEDADNSPQINFSFNLFDAAGPPELKDFLYALLYEGRKPDEYLEALIDEYHADYIKIQSLKEEASQKDTSPQDWEYTEYMNFRIFSDHWCVLSRDREYYTGGAHGMTQRNYYVIDVLEPKLLTLEDFFTDPGDPDLYQLALAALREYAGIEQDAPLSSAVFFDDNPALSADFFLDQDGAGFHWNPYEISPYSAGHIEVVIRWDKIRNFLTPNGQEMERDFAPIRKRGGSIQVP
jgi:hypothetical protein